MIVFINKDNIFLMGLKPLWGGDLVSFPVSLPAAGRLKQTGIFYESSFMKKTIINISLHIS